MSGFIDLTGKRFGKLLVIKRADNYVKKNGKQEARFVCKCDCGNITTVRAMHLKNGSTKSCGCLRAESTSHQFKKHGLGMTRLYGIWCGMKQRCSNSKVAAYKDYGARGIVVCREWVNDFQAFYSWAVSNGYNDNLSIDRIDVNGNYNPLNCRWADSRIQCRNRRNNVFIEYNGQKKILADWSFLTGIDSETISNRLNAGWNIRDTLTLGAKIGNNQTLRKEG
jgi:hypothetical protein